MFENGGDDSRFLGVFVRLVPTYGAASSGDRSAVVTSSPPFAEGGHLVMARELVRALRGSGHDAGLLVTPQNRFGRQGSAYLAAWCTDVELAHEEQQGRSGDHPAVSRLRGAASDHVVWLNHRMREYYDLWDQFSSHLSWKGRIKERMRRALIHRVDRHLLQARAAALRDLGARCRRGCSGGAAFSPTCCIRRRRSATTVTTATATTCSACRG